MAGTGQVIRLDFGASVGRRPNTTTYALVDVSEEQIKDLARGYVPRVVQNMAVCCLEWADQDERRAQRPVPARKKRSASR